MPRQRAQQHSCEQQCWYFGRRIEQHDRCRGSLYKGNGSNAVGVSFENAPIVLTASDPLFVSETNGRFIPAAGSQAIDSSIASLEERPALSDVKNGVKLPLSPMIAPSRDIGGLLRVDDPDVDTPQGQGQTVFIDVGR